MDVKRATIRVTEAAAAYCGTLLRNGVPPERIRSIRMAPPEVSCGLAQLRGIDGLLADYSVLLPSCRYALYRVCNPGRLHVDCLASVECRDILCRLLPVADSVALREDCSEFASMVVHCCRLGEAGARAAEMLLRICRDPELEPYTEWLDWE